MTADPRETLAAIRARADRTGYYPDKDALLPLLAFAEAVLDLRDQWLAIDGSSPTAFTARICAAHLDRTAREHLIEGDR